MSDLENAKQLMEGGWKAREAFDFETARKKLNQAKMIFEEHGDYHLVSEALNHMAYTEKLASTRNSAEALRLALESEKVCNENDLNPILAYRAVMSTAESAGNYELALRYAKEKMLPLLEKPILQGDLMSHIATFELRTGQLEKSAETIEKALRLIDEDWESERDPHRTIWKVRAMMTKAIISHNQGKNDVTQQILEEAKTLAEEQNLEPRREQVKELMKTLTQ